MTLLVSPFVLAPAAFLAGILMFLAPCTLPLVPAYLAFIAGMPESEVAASGRAAVRRRVFYNALAFVIGFSIVFILLGTCAAFIGSVLGVWRYTLARAAGALLILFGITMLGLFHLPLFSGEFHIRLPRGLQLGHPASAFAVGALFALGWSPCIGPILGSVLFIASASATALSGALLLGVFSLGLSLPFLLCALLLSEASAFTSRLAPLARSLQVIGGMVLVMLGVLMLLGDMGVLVSWGYGLFSSLGYDRLLNYL